MNSEFIRLIDGVTYLDETRLWASVSSRDTKVATRLSRFLQGAGVRFYDEEPGGYKFIQQPAVAITGFGGFPLSFDDTTAPGHVVLNKRVVTPAEILEEFRNTMGRAGFYSYMNPGNLTPDAMDAVTTKHRHFSKAHCVNIDMALLGYSAAIEGNLMILRRWFNHVGRLTNTRALAQSSPPLVVMEPGDLALAKALRFASAGLIEENPRPSTAGLPADKARELIADYHERINGFWPHNRALILMVNADLSNLRGTMGDIADGGQELECRRLLALMNDALYALFPCMLKHSSAYGYEMPLHWTMREAWEAQRDAFSKL